MNTTQDKKQHLLETGMAVIFRQGYNATGVQDIVNAAGVPKGSFYNYFTSKECFVVEGLSHMADQALACSRAVLDDSSLPPLQRIQQFFANGVTHQTDAGFAGGCVIGNLCQELADDSELVRERVNALMNTMIRMLAQCFAEAQERNEFCGQKSAADTAEFVFCAWEGALMRMKASKSDAPLQAFMRVLQGTCQPG